MKEIECESTVDSFTFERKLTVLILQLLYKLVKLGIVRA